MKSFFRSIFLTLVAMFAVALFSPARVYAAYNEPYSVSVPRKIVVRPGETVELSGKIVCDMDIDTIHINAYNESNTSDCMVLFREEEINSRKVWLSDIFPDIVAGEDFFTSVGDTYSMHIWAKTANMERGIEVATINVMVEEEDIAPTKPEDNIYEDWLKEDDWDDVSEPAEEVWNSWNLGDILNIAENNVQKLYEGFVNYGWGNLANAFEDVYPNNQEYDYDDLFTDDVADFVSDTTDIALDTTDEYIFPEVSNTFSSEDINEDAGEPYVTDNSEYCYVRDSFEDVYDNDYGNDDVAFSLDELLHGFESVVSGEDWDNSDVMSSIKDIFSSALSDVSVENMISFIPKEVIAGDVAPDKAKDEENGNAAEAAEAEPSEYAVFEDMSSFLAHINLNSLFDDKDEIASEVMSLLMRTIPGTITISEGSDGTTEVHISSDDLKNIGEAIGKASNITAGGVKYLAGKLDTEKKVSKSSVPVFLLITLVLAGVFALGSIFIKKK